MNRSVFALAFALPMLLGACSSPDDLEAPGTMDAEMSARLDSLDAAVADWRDAASLPEAHTAPEEACNLVVGPGGPLYGDADGDGVAQGQNGIGLLPGKGGEAGLA